MCCGNCSTSTKDLFVLETSCWCAPCFRVSDSGQFSVCISLSQTVRWGLANIFSWNLIEMDCMENSHMS